MRASQLRHHYAAVLILMLASAGCRRTAGSPELRNSATVVAGGAIYVTRLVPAPMTLSAEARRWISTPINPPANPTLEQRRASTDKFRIARAAQARQIFPVKIEPRTMAGVRTDWISPLETAPEKRACVLINVHGGGFNADSGSLVEGIPIAHLAQIPVVSVYYRLAPEYPFPAAVDDTVAVYRELLKTYQPANIGLFGTSAGAILTAEVASRLRQLHAPLPAALGIFSGMGDFSRTGDSQALYTTSGFQGTLPMPEQLGANSTRSRALDMYPGTTDRRDPVLSPEFSDLRDYPPTLFVASTRDLLLSGTVNLHRAFVRAGNDNARLVIFDGLPHAFWYNYEIPETREALKLMSDFFRQHVGAATK